MVASSADGMELDTNLGYCNGGSGNGLNLKHFSGLHEVGQFTSFTYNAHLIISSRKFIYPLTGEETLLPVDARIILMMNVISFFFHRQIRINKYNY